MRSGPHAGEPGRKNVKTHPIKALADPPSRTEDFNVAAVGKMTMFHLQTETERKLYIEALFHCLDRGTLTTRELLEDFNEIILTSGGGATADDRQMQRRIEGVLAAYKSHAITVDQASATLLSIFNELATPAGALKAAACSPDRFA